MSEDRLGFEILDKGGRTVAVLADALDAVAVMRALPDARTVVRLSDGEVIARSARGFPPVHGPTNDACTTTQAGDGR